MPWRAAISMLGVVGAAAGLWALAYRELPGKRAAAVVPPHPEISAGGDPIGAVFEGRVPCKKCLLREDEDRACALCGAGDQGSDDVLAGLCNGLGVSGANDRTEIQGTWREQRGAEGYPDAVVYALDERAPAELRYY